MGLKDELLGQLPQLAIALLASKAGAGPQGFAAFQKGQQDRAREEATRQRQAQLDQQAQEERAFSRQNVTADNTRQDETNAYNRFLQAYQQLQALAPQLVESSPDEATATSALAGHQTALEQAAKLQPGALGPATASVPQLVSGKQKRQAKEIYEAAEKRFGVEAMAQDSLTLQTQFGPKKPSELRVMFEAPAVDVSGAPARPKLPPKPTQIIDRGGLKQVVDPTALVPGQTFPDVAGPSAVSKERFWVIRNGKPIRIMESEYRPGDLPASTREQGRPVTSSDAGRMTELDTSLDDVDVLKSTIKGIPGATGTRARIGAALPDVITEVTGWGTSAKQKQAVIDRVKQVIGKALEGGVLRKEDESKYVKILPTIGDVADVVATKLEGLEQAILQRRERTVEALTDAGYDTKNFIERTPRKTGTGPATGDADDPLGLFK